MWFYISAVQHAIVLIMHTHIININERRGNKCNLKLQFIGKSHSANDSIMLSACSIGHRSFMHGDPHNHQWGSCFLFSALGYGMGLNQTTVKNSMFECFP